MPFPLIPVIAAAASLGASGLSAWGRKKSDQRANQYARESQDRADIRNLQFWRMQNRYNNPSSQMQRLRDAGLNPNLMYGNGSAATGNAGNIQGSKAAPTQSSNRTEDIMQFAQPAMNVLQSDNLKAQNTVLTQEAALKAAQTANAVSKTARNKFDLGLADELRNTSLQAAQINLQTMEERYYNESAKGESLRAKASLDWQSLPDRLKKITTDAKVAAATLKGKQLENKLSEYDKEIRLQYGIRPGDPLYYQLLGKLLKQLGIKTN